MRKAVDGVTAASFPVVAQALADEVKYGYRDAREAERLAGALVLLGGGARDGYSRATYYRRRSELRAAGYVVVEDFMEPVEVDLGGELERALEEFGG
jgi:sirohydrochlorin ferrochelatase